MSGSASRVRLTAKAVEQLPIRDERYTVWDDEVRGLMVRVTPNGVRSWLVDYVSKRDGKRTRRKIGDAAVLTPREARDIARAHLGDVARGRDPFEQKDRAKAAGTFREAATAYLKAHEGVHAKNTLNTRRTGLMVHAAEAFGGRPLLAVQREDVRKLHSKLVRAQPVTANRIVQAIRLLYRWCVDTGRAPEGTDPTRGVKLASEPKQHRVFSPDEYAQIEAAFDAEANEQATALAACECLRFVMLSGRRRDEARTLRWDDVDLTAGTMRAIATKTGTKDFVIPEPALAVLKRQRLLPMISPWVFPSPMDSRKPVVNVNGVWDRVKERASIDGRARIHDLRHSYAGRATALGLPLQVVAQFLGHDSIASTARYAIPHVDHTRAKANEVSETIAQSTKAAHE